ncbi:unnamed protein product [Blepharisma stoltei]|uniref:Uncharacterized protein n=1 Tax=Blepharisma stoltei TaxID=1481888 RepID=A0AAU9KBZ2_9CILI|nr:unnamed protein product [Blepharisma stoltei]
MSDRERTMFNLGQARKPKPTLSSAPIEDISLYPQRRHLSSDNSTLSPTSMEIDLQTILRRIQMDLNLDKREIDIYQRALDSHYLLKTTEEEKLSLADDENLINDLERMASRDGNRTISGTKLKENIEKYVKAKIKAEKLVKDYGRPDKEEPERPRSPSLPTFSTALSKEYIINALPSISIYETTNELNSAKKIIDIIIEQTNNTRGIPNRKSVIQLYTTYAINYLQGPIKTKKTAQISEILKNQLEKAGKSQYDFEAVFKALEFVWIEEEEYEIEPVEPVKPHAAKVKVKSGRPGEAEDIKSLKEAAETLKNNNLQTEKDIEMLKLTIEKAVKEKNILEKKLQENDLFLQKKLDEKKNYEQEHEAYLNLQKRQIELQEQLNGQQQDLVNKSRELEILKNQYESHIKSQEVLFADQVNELNELRQKNQDVEYYIKMQCEIKEENQKIQRKIEEIMKNGTTKQDLEKYFIQTDHLKERMQQLNNEKKLIEKNNTILDEELNFVLQYKQDIDKNLIDCYKKRSENLDNIEEELISRDEDLIIREQKFRDQYDTIEKESLIAKRNMISSIGNEFSKARSLPDHYALYFGICVISFIIGIFLSKAEY